MYRPEQSLRTVRERLSEDEIRYMSAKVQKIVWHMILFILFVFWIIGYVSDIWTGIPSFMMLTLCAIGYGTFAGACIFGVQAGYIENRQEMSRNIYLHTLRVLGFGAYFLWMILNVYGMDASRFPVGLVMVPIVMEVFLSLSLTVHFMGGDGKLNIIGGMETYGRQFYGLQFIPTKRNIVFLVSCLIQLILIYYALFRIAFLVMVLTMIGSIEKHDILRNRMQREEDYQNGSIWIRRGMIWVESVFLTAAFTRFLILADGRIFPDAWLMSCIPFVILFAGSTLFIAVSGLKLESFVFSFYRVGDEKNFYKKCSETDGMTGLYNKASLMMFLEERCRSSELSKKSFGFLMLDIDKFKNFNDKYGHREGDEAIVFIANVLQSVARGKDICARYGGEEFSAIVDNPDPMATGVLLSQRILSHVEIKSKNFFNERRKILEQQKLLKSEKKDDVIEDMMEERLVPPNREDEKSRNPDSTFCGKYIQQFKKMSTPVNDSAKQILDMPDYPEKLTVSAGFTIWRSGDTPESIIRRADAALYKAKENGRNCVFVCIGHKNEFFPVGKNNTEHLDRADDTENTQGIFHA